MDLGLKGVFLTLAFSGPAASLLSSGLNSARVSGTADRTHISSEHTKAPSCKPCGAILQGLGGIRDPRPDLAEQWAEAAGPAVLGVLQSVGRPAGCDASQSPGSPLEGFNSRSSLPLLRELKLDLRGKFERIYHGKKNK